MKNTTTTSRGLISDTPESVHRVIEEVDELAARGAVMELGALADAVWEAYEVKAGHSQVPLLDLYLYIGLVEEAGGVMDDFLRGYRDTVLPIVADEVPNYVEGPSV